MLVGSYHMARPAKEPAQQAHAFADRLQSAGGPQLPPVLDLEYDEGLEPAELAEWVQVFLDTLQSRTGRTPILYTYRQFWIEKMADTTRFAEYPLWLAEYGVSQPPLPVIGGWSEWLFWQRSDTGRVPGFVDHVDVNVFAGTPGDLDAWSGPVEPQPEPAEPPPEPAESRPEPAEPAPVASPRDEHPAEAHTRRRPTPRRTRARIRSRRRPSRGRPRDSGHPRIAATAGIPALKPLRASATAPARPEHSRSPS